MDADVRVWFNPACSKCRELRGLLEERGIEAEYRLYLDEPPTVAELAALVEKLGASPRTLVRAKDPAFVELDLAEAGEDRLLRAIAGHPALLERPIVETGGRAVVARPAARGMELFD
ncbi:MAG TPA: ArsC/Spx/MgsR family protein [Planctomycetota bacterium]